MTEGIQAFGATGKAKPKSTGTSRSTGPTVTVQRPDINVVRFLMAAVRAGDGVAEYPVLAENAVHVSDLLEAAEDESVVELLEGLDQAEIETVSLEDFFGVDLSGKGIEYVGTPPLLNEGDEGEFSELSQDVKDLYQDEDIYSYGEEENGLKKYILDPEWLEAEREGLLDDTVINHVNYALNGYYYPEIRQEIGGEEPARFKVQIGRNHNHTDEDGNVDEFSKRRHVAFTFETSATTDKRIISAAKNVGTIDQEAVQAYEAGEVDLDDIAEIILENRDEE